MYTYYPTRRIYSQYTCTCVLSVRNVPVPRAVIIILFITVDSLYISYGVCWRDSRRGVMPAHWRGSSEGGQTGIRQNIFFFFRYLFR